MERQRQPGSADQAPTAPAQAAVQAERHTADRDQHALADQLTALEDTALTELFAAPREAELGDTDDGAWLGLVCNSGRGGAILSETDTRGREAWSYIDDNDLTAAWSDRYAEYHAFQAATRFGEHNGSPPDTGPMPGRARPAIWVASTADFTDSPEHGAWLDATCDPEDLRQAIRFILRTSPTKDATDWAILGLDNFHGLRLDEDTPLAAISETAQGIARHGEAFARWAELAQAGRGRLADFATYYRGRYDSFPLYVDEALVAQGFWPQLEAAMALVQQRHRQYVAVNLAKAADDIARQSYVAPATDGGLHVFDLAPQPTDQPKENT